MSNFKTKNWNEIKKGSTVAKIFFMSFEVGFCRQVMRFNISPVHDDSLRVSGVKVEFGFNLNLIMNSLSEAEICSLKTTSNSTCYYSSCELCFTKTLALLSVL